MEKDTLSNIGKRIAYVRKTNGISQAVLAEQLSVSTKHISHVERGVSSLAFSHLVNFCEIFHVSLDYLVWGNNANETTAKLPQGIVDILNTGTEAELERLHRYMELYLELAQKQE